MSETGDGRPDRRAQIIEAAIESLKDVGYAGTSIREIARRGGFNSALISYYFSGLHGLLLAALDHSSAQRMGHYEAALEDASTLDEVVALARRIYRQDVRGGHITVFTEMVGASLARPELGPELVARVEPWIAFVERALEKVAGDNPLLQLVPRRDVAYAVVCFYLGVNVMTHLHDDERVEELFDLAGALAPALAPFVKRP